MEELKVVLQALGVLIIPFVSVMAAQEYGFWKETRQEAMRLFTRIIQECSEFRIAYIVFLIEENRLKQKQGESYLNQLAVREKAYDNLHMYIAKLRSHGLAAQLIFDRKGNALDSALSKLALLKYDGQTELDYWEVVAIKPLINNIEAEMRSLWKSLKNWTATDWAND